MEIIVLLVVYAHEVFVDSGLDDILLMSVLFVYIIISVRVYAVRDV